MIIVLKNNITSKERSRLTSFLSGKGFKIREIVGEKETVLGAVGSAVVDFRDVEAIPGVARVIPISKPYKMASRQYHPDDSVIKVGPVRIGGSRIVTMAGPCAVESREQILDVAWAVKEAGAVVLRGGAYKPRTSPYSFQGMGEKGLEYLKAAGEETGLPVVSEIVSPNDVDLMGSFVDIFQIGTRNMQNFELLKAVGAKGMPVLLKRGLAATIEEWLMAAEYLLASGTEDVILCERGIRTFGRATRNTLDLSAIPVVREISHLPIIVDPSHATGIRDKIPPMALAAVAAGAHGLIIEVHTDPDKAASDGAQTLWPQQFEKLLRDVEALCPTVGREMARLPERHQKDVIETHQTSSKATLKVAFQGEHGAYSERAAKNYFNESDIETTPFADFEGIFDAVVRKNTAWGVVPVENSLAGSVLENYDLFTRYPDIKIVGEIKVRIQHHLLVLPQSDESAVKKVFSHPQALSQCAPYIKKRGWDPTPYFDTAGAAAMVSRQTDSSLAAIASSDAASHYKLNILAENIETNPRNYTRFAIIAHVDTAEPENAGKTTFTFSVKSHPGALVDCLEILKRHDINMSRLESRPIAGKPWSYMFYVDALLPENRNAFSAMEKEFQEAAEGYRNLGFYRSG